MKTLILGAGFTGLAAGIKTGSTIYEATDKAGGICTDYVKDGFRFSNGGPHLIFGKGEGLDYIKTMVEVKEYERKAGVYYNHTFPYPFQRVAEDLDGVVIGNTFKQDLYDSFGLEQCNLFFYPFNEKYTARLMDKIIPQDRYKSPKTGTGWVSTFCDPVGGLSTLVDKMAKQCTIEYNKKAVSIDTHNKIVKFEDSMFVKYDRLISTIPLNKCMELCGEKVNLPYTSVFVINIGAEPDINCPTEHWIYVPFCKSGFHRVAFYSNVDKYKAPPGKVGISVEIAYHNKNFNDLDSSKIIDDVLMELVSWRWIKEEKTIGQADWVECAYTWQYNKEDVPNAIKWLADRDIVSTGRYGKWHFQGLTQSIEDGFNV